MEWTSAAAFNEERQQKLESHKRALRTNNEKYFRAHPELREMVATFMNKLLDLKPVDATGFARGYFTDPAFARQLGFHGWTRPVTPIAYEAHAEEGMQEGNLIEENEMNATTGEDALGLEQVLISLFKEADADNSGALDYDEFHELMMTADIGLSRADIQMMISEADEDESGQIEYAEFVPLAVEVIQTMRLKHRVAEVEEEATPELLEVARSMLPNVSLSAVSDVLSAAGATNTGTFTRAQLKAALKSPKLGLSPTQINLAVLNVTFPPGGKVDANIVAPIMYDILVQGTMQALQQQVQCTNGAGC